MKKNIKYLAIAALLSSTIGCSDDLLDNSGVSGQSQPTRYLTSSQLEQGTITNPAIPAAFVKGIYAQMIQTQTGGTTGHDDFGHKSYDIFGDFVSGDMALSQSTFGWYRANIAELQACEDFTQDENRMIWRFYYRLIRGANNVIASLGGNDAMPETLENRHSMGQAKAMRAFCYFYLTQYYQKEYNASEEILPMYTEPIVTNLPKTTAEEIYNLMESDLRTAISLLGDFNRGTKAEVNQDIAKTLLAYVLGAKGGNDSEVATITKEVIDTNNYTMLASAEVTNGFNDVASPSWMWGIDITETNELGLISWWGQIDAYSYSYAWAGDYKAIDANLYAAIPADDARKAQFFNNPANGRHLQPLRKFYASATIGGASRTVTADYVYMRIEEVVLLNAEANAKAGNEAAARESLKALVSRRRPDASYIDGLSGQGLLNEIYLQTRVELWGEGKSYLALKRNKRSTTRGANHLSLVGETINYDDERLTFEIPLDEIQSNPFISGQNL